MAFIDELRDGTNYPAFRGLVKVAVALCYLAGLITVAAMLPSGEPGLILMGLVAVSVFLVIVHALYEATMMVADIADATVKSAAERADTASSPAPNLDWDHPVPPR